MPKLVKEEIFYITIKDWSFLLFSDKWDAGKHFNLDPGTVRMLCSESNRFFLGKRDNVKYQKEGIFILKNSIVLFLKKNFLNYLKNV